MPAQALPTGTDTDEWPGAGRTADLPIFRTTVIRSHLFATVHDLPQKRHTVIGDRAGCLTQPAQPNPNPAPLTLRRVASPAVPDLISGSAPPQTDSAPWLPNIRQRRSKLPYCDPMTRTNAGATLDPSPDRV